jgi:uncharacterized membrane protein YfcA
MEFPIAGVTVNPLLLTGIGSGVGILGGFFGVGGGFIAGPLMSWASVPMNFVVGTDLAHMRGAWTSSWAWRWRWAPSTLARRAAGGEGLGAAATRRCYLARTTAADVGAERGVVRVG